MYGDTLTRQPPQLQAPQAPQQAVQQQVGAPTGQPNAATPAPAGAPAAQTPAVSSAPNVNLTPAYSQVNFDPNSFMATLNQYLQPQFNQQDMALTNSLADAGIVGGSTAGAEAQLGQQQQLTEQGGAQDALMQLLGLNLNQSEFNAGGFNTNEDILAQMQNQDYLTQMGLNENLLAGGAGSQNPIYQSPGQVNLSGLGAGIGQSSTPAVPNVQPYIPPLPGYGENTDPNFEGVGAGPY